MKLSEYPFCEAIIAKTLPAKYVPPMISIFFISYSFQNSDIIP